MGLVIVTILLVVFGVAVLNPEDKAFMSGFGLGDRNNFVDEVISNEDLK